LTGAVCTNPAQYKLFPAATGKFVLASSIMTVGFGCLLVCAETFIVEMSRTTKTAPKNLLKNF
jgi:hypothetical protein